MEWNNQMSLLPKPQNEKDMEILRIHARARDNLMEISSTITALENVVDMERGMQWSDSWERRHI